MSNLNNRGALHPRWTKIPVSVLEAFESVIIAIFDPRSETSGDNYSPYVAGTGTSVPLLLWQGKAQFQVYRQSLTVDDVAGSVSQLRSVRITAPPDGPTMPLRKGLIVRIISSPLNPALESYEVTVTNGMTAALAWKRTIEGEVDQSVIAPPITDYDVL